MKIGTIVMMVMAVVLNLGVAHAVSMSPSPGFDRVGLTPVNATQAPVRAQSRAAPGEDAEQGLTDHQVRKREMARRLVWLMLNAN